MGWCAYGCSGCGCDLTVAAVPSTVAAWDDILGVWQAVLFALVSALAVGLIAGLVAFLQWIGGAPATAARATLAAERAELGQTPASESERIHRKVLEVAGVE